MAKKGGREKIRLNSTAGTGHFYTTDKNRRTTPGKMEMMKYDPVVRQHVLYKEGKIKELILEWTFAKVYLSLSFGWGFLLPRILQKSFLTT